MAGISHGRQLVRWVVLSLAIHGAVIGMLRLVHLARAKELVAAPVYDVELAVEISPEPVRPRRVFAEVSVDARGEQPRAVVSGPAARRRAVTASAPHTPLRPATRKAVPAPAPLSLRMRPLDLIPGAKTMHDAWSREQSDESAASPNAEKESKTGDEAGRTRSRIDGWLQEDEGRRNAESGRAHSALYTLLRRVDRAFTPTKDVVPSRMRRFGPQTVKAYQAAIDQFNRMGSPLPFDPDSTGESITPLYIIEGNKQIDGHVAQAAGKKLATRICIQAVPGKTPVIKQVVSSGLRPLDKLALAAMNKALGPMPEEMPRCRVCFTFNIDFGRIAPSGYLNCVAAGILDGFKCLRDGGEWFRHAVRLAQVWALQVQDTRGGGAGVPAGVGTRPSVRAQ